MLRGIKLLLLVEIATISAAQFTGRSRYVIELKYEYIVIYIYIYISLDISRLHLQRLYQDYLVNDAMRQ